MPLLTDYAITPDVFDVTSYSTPRECEARLDTIRDAMLSKGPVRNLREERTATMSGVNSIPPPEYVSCRRASGSHEKTDGGGRAASSRPARPTGARSLTYWM